MNLWLWLRAEWDRVAGVALVVLGAVFLVVGYVGVRDSPFLAEQLAYIASGGLGGLFCLGLGVGLLLSADLHDEWRKLDRIETAVRGEPLPDPTAALEGIANGEGLPQGAVSALARNGPGDQLGRARAGALVALAVPLVLMAAGWRQAHGTDDLEVALRGVAVGTAGLTGAVAVVAGHALWLRSRLVRREAQLFEEPILVARQKDRLRSTLGSGPRNPGRGPAEGPVFVVAGLRRFHQEGCPALKGLSASPVGPGEAEERGLMRCGICCGAGSPAVPG